MGDVVAGTCCSKDFTGTGQVLIFEEGTGSHEFIQDSITRIRFREQQILFTGGTEFATINEILCLQFLFGD